MRPPLRESERGLLSSAAVGALVIGLLAFAFRYLTIGTIENDHFVMLARAQQVLHGDWPVRDFEDPGQPLFYLLTAGLTVMTGHVLATNIVLCLLLQAIAASCTYFLARRASGSTLVGVASAIVAIVSSPRLYNTTKVIVPVVAILVQWRYADRPGTRRLIAVAAWTAIAFLLRHDYAVYTVASTVVLLAVRHASEPSQAVRRIAAYGGIALLCVLPWLAYVQWHEGMREYVSAALRFVASEGRRTASGPPQILYYFFALLPLCGFVLAFRSPRRIGPGRVDAAATLDASQLASTSLLVLMMNAVFLRDVLLVRLPDAIAPTAILAAAVLGRLFGERTLRVGALIVSGLAIVVASVGLTVAGYRVPTPAAIVRQSARIADRLLHVSPAIQPGSPYAPVIAFLAQCTPADERVFVSGFGPQVPFLAGRLFAGGLPSWIPGYYETPADIARARRRLERERVSAAVMLEGTPAFERSWPELAAWFRERGFQEYAFPGGGDERIWLPPPTAGPIDDASRVPCGSPSPVPVFPNP